MIFQTIECVPSSGKTKAILNHINQTGEKAIIASISMMLSKQSYDYYTNEIKGKSAVIVDTDHRTKRTNNDALKEVVEQYDVIFITHAALKNIDDFELYKEYSLYIDEVPDLVSFESLRFNSNINHIHDICLPFSCNENDIVDLVLDEEKRDLVTRLAYDGLRKRDDIAMKMFPLYRALLGSIPVKMQYSPTGYVCYFVEDHDVSQWKFKNVTIASSNIKGTITGKILNTFHDVEFEDSPLQTLVDFKQYKNTDRITIHVLSDGDYSRYTGDLSQSGTTVYTQIKKRVEELLGGEQFIYCTNTYRSKFSEGQEIPYNSHGLNFYSSYTNVVALFSYNPLPWLRQMLRAVAVSSGLGEDELVHSYVVSKYYEPAFQLCARSDIRHNNSRKKINLFVPDLRLANYMKEKYFPDAKIESQEAVTTKRKRQSFQTDYAMDLKEKRAFAKFKERNSLEYSNPDHHIIVKDWLSKYREKKAT
ncbi:MAG: hypothetical protein [Enterobacter phage ENC7]|nr:MAG: hypothetical protein [Enterobacter phage ENC7]UIW11938.1 MAG: hypothetical protein [Enterobacter phage ENC25]UIW12196.1 MAG: hypothetical protein [Enterobacter phage ENC22]UJB55393.1 hypothetical protein [Enterobacter phage vB_EcRAM-01]